MYKYYKNLFWAVLTSSIGITIFVYLTYTVYPKFGVVKKQFKRGEFVRVE